MPRPKGTPKLAGSSIKQSVYAFGVTAGTVQTGDNEAAEQVVELERLGPKLAMLHQLLADANTAQLHALRDFATNHPDLQSLEELLAKARLQATEFNLFELLNLWRREDTHSRILTWLLDSNSSHNVGDYFLREFLLVSGSSAFDASDDWSNTESKREWYSVVDGKHGWLDILVLNSDTKFLCAIENKISAPEGARQLTHYRKALEDQYPSYKRHYVFLSPSGIDPRWEKEQEYWKSISYSAVLQIVEQTIDDNAAIISEAARDFLRQYATTLRRNIVPESDEIAELARRLYVENREVIELIYRYRPNYQAETNQILQDAIKRQENWSLDDTNTRYVRFLPTEWEEFQWFRTGTGWPSKAVILFEFHCKPDNHGFCLVLAPSEEPIRSALFEGLKQHPRVFNNTRGTLRDKYHHVNCQDSILEESDFNNWFDTDSLGPSKLKQCVADFARNEFPAMNEIIVSCFSEYEKGVANH